MDDGITHKVLFETFKRKLNNKLIKKNVAPTNGTISVKTIIEQTFQFYLFAINVKITVLYCHKTTYQIISMQFRKFIQFSCFERKRADTLA